VCTKRIRIQEEAKDRLKDNYHNLFQIFTMHVICDSNSLLLLVIYYFLSLHVIYNFDCDGFILS